MSDTKLHHISTTRTARYYSLGELSDQTRNIWIVLHGYGQLAGYFIRHFKNILNDHNFIVAPEALSRYYVNEATGRVGASWMTKEDRENEINDYLLYLDNILGSLNVKIPKNCKIHVLGFSQGAATACRWTMATATPVKTLICWAGFFPPGMKWDSPKYLNDQLETYLLYGNQDEYVNDTMRVQIENLVKSLQKKPNIITFEGRHEIVGETLINLSKSVENQ
jgi:predicted esterase